MTMNLKLPGWAQAALVSFLLISLGVNGTLLLIDRNNIATLVKEQKDIMSAVVVTVNSQNRIIDRVCGLLTLNYEQRMKHLTTFPLTRPEDIRHEK